MGYVESSERALGFKANGAERMRIDSSGKVLINTTTASSYADRLLTVGNTSHTSPTIEIRSATNGFPGLVFSDSTVADVNSYRGAIEYSHSSNHMQIRTNSDVRMLIDSSGRVGIGATSFNDTRERLRIQSPSGSDTFVTIKAPSNSGESALFFGDSDFNRGAVSYEHSGDNMLFRVNDAERMRVDSSGRLIIGTGGDVSGGDTDVKLQVASGSGPSIQLCRTDSSTTANELLGRIFASTEDGGTSQVCGQITFRAEGSHTINDHATRIEFATTKDGANGVTERMRISEDGSLHHNSNSHGIATYLTASAGTAKYAFRGHNNTSSGIYGGTISFTVWSNGNVENTNDSYGGISDVKLKENIVDAGSQWDDFKAVKFRKYNFKEETGLETHTQLGVIAQELELTSPGLVYETADKDEDGNDLGTTTKAVKSSILTKKALVALQEAMARIEQLETKVAALEAG